MIGPSVTAPPVPPRGPVWAVAPGFAEPVAVSGLASDFGASGLIAALPVALDFAGSAGLGEADEEGAAPVGIALLPVAADLTGGTAPDAVGPAPGLPRMSEVDVDPLPGSPLFAEGVPPRPAADAAGLAGSPGFGAVDPAAGVVLGGTAELLVGPGLASDVAVPPLVPETGFDGSLGFGAVDPAATVALGETAELPVGPGLAGDALGVADGVPAADPLPDTFSVGRSVGLPPSSFDAVTDVSFPSDRARTVCRRARPIDWRPSQLVPRSCGRWPGRIEAGEQ